MSEKKDEIEVVYIDIEDLGIDAYNVRGGEWNCDEKDEELIQDVKNNWIINPVTVRPAHPSTGKKYAIVAGSRRYHAAIEANLPKLPCIIRILNDAEALAFSMAENRYRVDTPVWRDIEVTGRIWEHKEFRYLSYNEKTKKLGISQPTVDRYLRIFGLREEVKGLLKQHDERSPMHRSYLDHQFPWWDASKVLPVGHADLLTELKDFPLEKQVEVGIYIIDFTEKEAEKFIQYVKLHPDQNIKDIHNEHNGKLNGVHEITSKFDVAVWGALEKACMAKQKPIKTLLEDIVTEWLRARHFLVDEIKEVPQQRGLKEYISDAEPNCESVAGGSHA